MNKYTAAIALLTLTGVQPIQANPTPESSLDTTTILAHRSLTDLTKVGSAVTILDTEALQKTGTFQIDEALKFIPGAVAESTGGQPGTVSSIFLRGTNTDHAHIRVDGIRLSGSNILSGNFLGNAGIAGLARIEVLRGPQSALYGGDSIGGVIGLYSKRGSGDPGGSLLLETGSHNSFRSSLGFQGQIDKLSYNLNLGYYDTENDLPNNDFNIFSQSLRLDYQVNETLDIGLTLRSFQSDLRRPNYSDPTFARAADDETESTLASVFANLQVNEIWTTKLTLGAYWETYYADNFQSPRFFETDAEKFAAYWDNTLQWNDHHTTIAGIVYEKTDYTYASLFFAPVVTDSRSSTQYGAYLHHAWDITGALTLNGGIRWEDYDQYGDEFTWRTSVAYRIAQTNTKLRASYGKAFRPPSFQELFGFGGGSNFSLEAESSSGWDVGIDQSFCDGQYTVSATWFENKIENLIDSDFGPPPLFLTTNFNTLGTSTSRGLEIEAHGKWLNDKLQASLNYTWLDETLMGQPEHSAGLRVNANITDKLEAGFSVIYSDDRTFGGNPIDAYTLTNLHTNYRLNDCTTLHLRIENLFDKNYELVSFGTGINRSTFPARGRGIFGGITLEW